ncbi:uncharacterized protein LOC111708563 [Eurytemora carolleeae]|uniref:uncharacterized protein LOC111708563 n=1 Tax=Eurytemora carolleeae TaxID=1294199 RepID=UPI000C76957B|nr:uncharacterized protein LOC111708563 [Eurytemora carolleeae]|eukprot:XP_023337750.1 uncharacterized protein LOC111708563 [Eurytemora affinis]
MYIYVLLFLVTFLLYWYIDRRKSFRVLTDYGYRVPPVNLLFGNLLQLVQDDLGTMERWMEEYGEEIGEKGGKIMGWYRGPSPAIWTTSPEFLKEVFIKDAETFIDRPMLDRSDNIPHLINMKVNFFLKVLVLPKILNQKLKWQMTMFNDKLLDYRENGDLERLGRFWLHGTCKPNEQEKRASEPLSEAQFLSAFLLLVCGIITSIFLLTCEHIYLRYFSPTLREKTIYNSWVSIFNKDGASQSRNQLVRKLASTKLCSTRRTSVRSFLDLGYGDQNCGEDVCKTKLRRLRGDLDCARDQIRMLEDQLNKHGIPLRRTSKEIAEKETVL